MWVYVGYSNSTVGCVCTMCQAYLFMVYAINVKCMYSAALGHTVDSSEFYEAYIDMI